MWPLVLGAFHFFLLLLSLAYIGLALLPYERLKGIKAGFDLCSCGVLFNFWVAWMIWGNIIIYK
jgi:hypothetical protein